MIRHDLHRNDDSSPLLADLRNDLLEPLIDRVDEDLTAVFRTPYHMEIACEHDIVIRSVPLWPFHVPLPFRDAPCMNAGACRAILPLPRCTPRGGLCCLENCLNISLTFIIIQCYNLIVNSLTMSILVEER